MLSMATLFSNTAMRRVVSMSVTLRAKPKMFFNLVEPVGVLTHGNAKRRKFAFDIPHIALHPDE